MICRKGTAVQLVRAQPGILRKIIGNWEDLLLDMDEHLFKELIITNLSMAESDELRKDHLTS